LAHATSYLGYEKQKISEGRSGTISRREGGEVQQPSGREENNKKKEIKKERVQVKGLETAVITGWAEIARPERRMK
jgi:hypothetical protein